MYIPQVVRKRGNEGGREGGRGGVVEVENCGVRHAPDVDAEMGWRVASVDRDATIFCRGENFMAGAGMGQEGVIWKGGEAQFNLRGGGGANTRRGYISLVSR